MERQTADSAYLTAFGSHLRTLRMAAGLSQEELADRAGIHVTYLSGIERGRRNTSVLSIRKLAQGLNLGAAELFSFDPDQKPVR